MDRLDRRSRAEKVAQRRLKSLRERGEGQLVGWFRKWNLTCDCSMCKAEKYSDIQLQRFKDLRRNSLPELV